MLCLYSCSSRGWARQGPKHFEDSNVTYMLLLNCALKLGEEIILYYDARSKKHQITDDDDYPYLDRNMQPNYLEYKLQLCSC